MFTADQGVPAAQLRNALADNEPVRLLDVRTPAEFEAVSIPGAHNVPLDTLDEYVDQLAAVEAPLVIVCRSGQRSSQAESRLIAAGATNVGVLDGGMQAWQSIDGPTRRGAQRWDLERQVRLVAGGLVLTGIAASTVVPRMKYLSGAIGAGLTVAALTDSCLMAQLLAKLPYNNPTAADVETAVAELQAS